MSTRALRASSIRSSNQFVDASEMLPPYNNPPPGQPATMDGFVWDYCNNFVATHKRNPDVRRISRDHGQLQPGAAAGDQHARQRIRSLRRMVLRGAHADDTEPVVLPRVDVLRVRGERALHEVGSTNDGPTIFNRLSDAGLTWRVYYDETQIVPLTALLHGAMLVPYWRTNFYTMTEFYKDVANGTLPAYAFVEPRMIYNNNDFHPPAPSSSYRLILRSSSAACPMSATAICSCTRSTAPYARAQPRTDRTRSTRCCC